MNIFGQAGGILLLLSIAGLLALTIFLFGRSAFASFKNLTFDGGLLLVWLLGFIFGSFFGYILLKSIIFSLLSGLALGCMLFGLIRLFRLLTPSIQTKDNFNFWRIVICLLLGGTFFLLWPKDKPNKPELKATKNQIVNKSTKEYTCRVVGGHPFVQDRNLLDLAWGYHDRHMASSNPKLNKALNQGELVFFNAKSRGTCVDHHDIVQYQVPGWGKPFWTYHEAVQREKSDSPYVSESNLDDWCNCRPIPGKPYTIERGKLDLAWLLFLADDNVNLLSMAARGEILFLEENTLGTCQRHWNEEDWRFVPNDSSMSLWTRRAGFVCR